MATVPYQLPEEILLQILTYLDEVPPSVRKGRREPSLRLASSSKRSLKAVSLVSKQWRRLTIPLLFKHARIDLTKGENSVTACARSTAREEAIVEQSTEDDRSSKISSGPNDPSNDLDGEATISLSNNELSTRRLKHASGDADLSDVRDDALFLEQTLSRFLSFVYDQDVNNSIESVVLLSNTSLTERPDSSAHQSVGKDRRYQAAAQTWKRLFAVTNPTRAMIVAPPRDLAALTNCAIDTSGDWAFSDMEFHIIELQRDDDGTKPSKAQITGSTDELDYMPRRYPGLARSSLLNLRPWSRVSINEGSFLKAYGTYEFFERGPPSLVYSIKDCLMPRPIFSPHRRISDTPLASLRSFTYTAMFPFAHHLDFRDLLPQLEELDLQLAPDPKSNILDSKDRVGKAELDDCWSELFSVYHHVTACLSTFSISEARCPRMKRFVCRDMQIPALQDELDEIFVQLCLPAWAEYQPGVFTRLAMSADVLGVDRVW